MGFNPNVIHIIFIVVRNHTSSYSVYTQKYPNINRDSFELIFVRFI